MKSLTKTWFDFKNLSCNKNDCIFTTRLFWQKLEDENKKEKPMYVAVNTLSGAIDIFRQEEGEKVEKAIKTNKLNEIEDVLFSKLRTKGYVFPSKESEEIYFKSGIHAYKNERYQKNRNGRKKNSIYKSRRGIGKDRLCWYMWFGHSFS